MPNGLLSELPLTIISAAIIFLAFYILMRGVRVFRSGPVNAVLAFLLTIMLVAFGGTSFLIQLLIGSAAFALAAALFVGVLALSSILRKPVLTPVVTWMRHLPRRKAIGLFAVASLVPAASIGIGFGVALGFAGFLIGFGVGAGLIGGMFALEWVRQKTRPGEQAKIIAAEAARVEEMERAKAKIEAERESVEKLAEKGEIGAAEEMKVEEAISEQEKAMEEVEEREMKAVGGTDVAETEAALAELQAKKKKEEKKWKPKEGLSYAEIWAEYQRVGSIGETARNLGMSHWEVERVVKAYQALEKKK